MLLCFVSFFSGMRLLNVHMTKIAKSTQSQTFVTKVNKEVTSVRTGGELE